MTSRSAYRSCVTSMGLKRLLHDRRASCVVLAAASLHEHVRLAEQHGHRQICWNPRIWMDTLTFGWTIEADINDDTECVFIWGTNPAESDNSLWWQSIRRIGKSDTPLVVIDPRYTKTASCADLWIAPKTGTDCALRSDSRT